MRVWKTIRNIILILLVLVLVAGVVFYYMLSQVPIRAIKHLATFEVTYDEIADYTVFINPTGKYARLVELDDGVRCQIADYMKKNNHVLQLGEQTFFAIEDATFEELVTENFKFEKKTDDSN